MNSVKCVVCGDMFNCDIIQPISVCSKCRDRTLQETGTQTELVYELMREFYQDGYEQGVRDFAERIRQKDRTWSISEIEKELLGEKKDD